MHNVHRIATEAEARLLRATPPGGETPPKMPETPVLADAAKGDISQKHKDFKDNVKKVVDDARKLTSQAVDQHADAVDSQMGVLNSAVSTLVQHIERNDESLRTNVKQQIDLVMAAIQRMRQVYQTETERRANPYSSKATETRLQDQYGREIKRFGVGLRLELPADKQITVHWANGTSDTFPNYHVASTAYDHFINTYKTVDREGRQGNTIYLMGADQPFTIVIDGVAQQVTRGMEPFKGTAEALPDIDASSAGALKSSAERPVERGEMPEEAQLKALAKQILETANQKIASNAAKNETLVQYGPSKQPLNKVLESVNADVGMMEKKPEKTSGYIGELGGRLERWQNVLAEIQALQPIPVMPEPEPLKKPADAGSRSAKSASDAKPETADKSPESAELVRDLMEGLKGEIKAVTDKLGTSELDLAVTAFNKHVEGRLKEAKFAKVKPDDLRQAFAIAFADFPEQLTVKEPYLLAVVGSPLRPKDEPSKPAAPEKVEAKKKVDFSRKPDKKEGLPKEEPAESPSALKEVPTRFLPLIKKLKENPTQDNLKELNEEMTGLDEDPNGANIRPALLAMLRKELAGVCDVNDNLVVTLAKKETKDAPKPAEIDRLVKKPRLPKEMRPGESSVFPLPSDTTVTAFKTPDGNPEGSQSLGAVGTEISMNGFKVKRVANGIEVRVNKDAAAREAVTLDIGNFARQTVSVTDVKAEEAKLAKEKAEALKKDQEHFDGLVTDLKTHEKNLENYLFQKKTKAGVADPALDALVKNVVDHAIFSKKPPEGRIFPRFFGYRISSPDGHKYFLKYDETKHKALFKDETQEEIDAENKKKAEQKKFFDLGKELEGKLNVLLSDKNVRKLDSNEVKTQLGAIKELEAFRAMKKPEAKDDAWLKDLDLDYSFTTKDKHSWKVSYDKARHQLMIVDHTQREIDFKNDAEKAMNEDLAFLRKQAETLLSDVKKFDVASKDGTEGILNREFSGQLNALWAYGIDGIRWPDTMDDKAKQQAIAKALAADAVVLDTKLDSRASLVFDAVGGAAFIKVDKLSDGEHAAEIAKEKAKPVNDLVAEIEKANYVVKKGDKYVLNGITPAIYKPVADKLGQYVAAERAALETVRTSKGDRAYFNERTLRLNEIDEQYLQLGEGADTNVDTYQELEKSLTDMRFEIAKRLDKGEKPSDMFVDSVIGNMNEQLDKFPHEALAQKAVNSFLQAHPTEKGKNGEVYAWKLEGGVLGLSETADSKLKRVSNAVKAHPQAKDLQQGMAVITERALTALKTDPAILKELNPQLDAEGIKTMRAELQALQAKAALKDTAFVEMLSNAPGDIGQAYVESTDIAIDEYERKSPIRLEGELTVEQTTNRTNFETAIIKKIANGKFELLPHGKFDAQTQFPLSGNASEKLRAAFGVPAGKTADCVVKVKFGPDGKVVEAAFEHPDGKKTLKGNDLKLVTAALAAAKGKKPADAHAALLKHLNESFNTEVRILGDLNQLQKNAAFQLLREHGNDLEVTINGKKGVLKAKEKLPAALEVGGTTLVFKANPNGALDVKTDTACTIEFRTVKGTKKGELLKVNVKD